MKRDIYDRELYPGDIAVVHSKSYFGKCKISQISAKGTIYIQKWSDEHQLFGAQMYKFRGYNIIKISL